MRSILSHLEAQSPLKNIAPLQNKEGRVKKAVIATLILTPLVDAFAILVIYLLVNTVATSEVKDLDKTLKIPKAYNSSTFKGGLVVQIKGKQYFIDKKRVSDRAIIKEMKKYAKKTLAMKDKTKASLVIVSDKKTSFKMINPLMIWASEFDISKVQLAVLRVRGAG